jgi:hypothetical protein
MESTTSPNWIGVEGCGRRAPLESAGGGQIAARPSWWVGLGCREASEGDDEGAETGRYETFIFVRGNLGWLRTDYDYGGERRRFCTCTLPAVSVSAWWGCGPACQWRRQVSDVEGAGGGGGRRGRVVVDMQMRVSGGVSMRSGPGATGQPRPASDMDLDRLVDKNIFFLFRK